MKSTLIWLILTGAILLCGDSVGAWNRQLFNRYSRNLFRDGDVNAASTSVAGTGAASNNEIDEFNALFGNGNNGDGRNGIIGVGGGANYFIDDGVDGVPDQQQTEVYGIVEPVESLEPCWNRPCQINGDCCPKGVCINSYGEGKCIYVYGHKHDLCHSNGDCAAGMSCLKAIAGNFVCAPTLAPLRMAGGGSSILNSGITTTSRGANALEVKQFGEDCLSSTDCNVYKGMCCQLQRNHHRVVPKRICAYFRDPFMCIDIMPTEDEEVHGSRLLSAYSQRRM